jgi:hypothetical protein
MTDEDKDIMTISLTHKDNRGPLRMVSGEQLEKWRAIERVARRLVHNKHLAVGNQPLVELINILAITLAMPSDEQEPSTE